MPDVVDAATRSRMMSGIRGKNTKPELLIRSALHRRGYRFRLHRKDLPGRPDLVLPRYRAVVFVNGCFWHGHRCHLFVQPASNREFWLKKIEGNRRHDAAALKQLRQLGWRSITVWECALRGTRRVELDALTERIAAWLDRGVGDADVAGGQ